VITCLSFFGYLDRFRRYSRSKFEVAWNRAEFCMFLAPNFFGEGPPEFLDLHYKEHPYCDHVAKFRGDRQTEVGGSPANKKTSRVKHKAFGINVPGGITRKSCTGQAQCEVSAYTPSCSRCVATYWKDQTRGAQNCKYLR